ncbi:MAG: anti-sigma F factor [Alicyclobacillus sp.]|nr:anti-sigma F factor [Alicyclobacillus sp.]
MRLQFASRSENEAFARVAVGAFVAQLDPTMEQLTELKTAVSEAVTNAIIHGYDGTSGEVRITCALWPGMVEITVEDDGCGIEDIEQAMQPLYTTKPELERSGMGLTIMENFVDELYIDSSPQHGTRVRMRKSLASVPQGQ